MRLQKKSNQKMAGKTLAISLFAVFMAGCLGGGGSGGSGSPTRPTDESSNPPESPSDPLIASTSQGLYAGLKDDGMRVFRGIRYGEAQRFSAPLVPQAHEGTIQLDAFGDACAQPDTTFGEPSSTEDCLFLNVYAPEAPGDYPVMVWIHGGALLGGQGGAEYEPQEMVKQGIVVVTINYRLGALGFLPHVDLGGSNFGLQDQRLALQWIQKDIGAFGGDPDNVTIFGESAGGHSVLSHLVSPETAGLFHRAIVQSGSYNGAQLPLEDVANVEVLGRTINVLGGQTLIGEPIVERIKENAPEICTTDASLLDCLRSVDLDVILTAQSEVLAERQIEAMLPVTGTSELPNSINAALDSGKFNKVPVMIGSNLDEGDLFMLVATANGVSFYPDSNFRASVATLIKQNRLLDSTKIADHYLARARSFIAEDAELRRELAAAEPIIGFLYPYWFAYSMIITDWRFNCPNQNQLELMQDKVDTYGYWFTDRESAEVSPLNALTQIPLGAGHAFELPYLLNTTERFINKGATDEQQNLAERMVQYWTNFAKYGDPNRVDGSSEGIEWPRHTVDGSIIALNTPLPSKANIDSFAERHNCAFWENPPLVAE